MDKICAALLLFVFLIDKTDCQIVSTSVGRFRGTNITTPMNFKMTAYLSVPYAVTPPGRFSKPQTLRNFTGVFNSTTYRSQCARWGLDGATLDDASGEDCLYLKILTPVSPKCCLPVLVWFSSGGFNDGGYSDYDNGALGDNFVSKTAIVVQVNYRQGPFGFFTTGTSDAPGNYGVWDAFEALKFVRAYIRPFGGDPTRVTIMGIEAGAVMTELIHLSPLANTYYSSAIYISGTAFDPVIVKNDAVNIARSLRLAIAVGCTNNTQQSLWNTGRRAQVLTCLKSRSTADITEAIGRDDIVDSSSLLHNYFWRPRTDGSNGIFPNSFDNLAIKRLNVPVMAGIMKDDWMTELVLLPSVNADGSVNINSSWNVPQFVRNTCDTQLNDTDIYGSMYINRLRETCKIRYVESYLSGKYGRTYLIYNRNFWLRQAGRVATALHNMAPLIKSLSYMRRTSNLAVWLYSWDYDGADIGTYWATIGASRYLELSLLTNYFPIQGVTATTDDNTIMSTFGDLVVNFATEFNPTPDDYTRITNWLTYGNDYRFLSFNVTSSMQTSFYQDDVLFWLNNGCI